MSSVLTNTMPRSSLSKRAEQVFLDSANQLHAYERECGQRHRGRNDRNGTAEFESRVQMGPPVAGLLQPPTGNHHPRGLRRNPTLERAARQISRRRRIVSDRTTAAVVAAERIETGRARAIPRPKRHPRRKL
jgi:hypothetical protein